MARRAACVAFATVALALAVPANAQTLALLHERAFTLSTDASSVSVGQAFHVTLLARVDEKIDVLDNVQLPSLAGFEDLGDERRCARSASGQGTDCVEIVTMDANAPGDRSIGPAALEFVDASNGRVRSLESNVITIHVTGNAKTTPDPNADVVSANPLGDLLWAGVRGFVIFVLVAIAGWALIWGYRKRPVKTFEPSTAAAPVLVTPVVPVQSWATRMRELGTFLASEPSRARVVAVRAELRSHLGATERETIADLVRRRAGGDDTYVMPALAAVERAAFCEDGDVAGAAREAVPFLMQ